MRQAHEESSRQASLESGKAGKREDHRSTTATLRNVIREADTASDPMNDRKWIREDTRSISDETKARRVELCPNTAGQLLPCSTQDAWSGFLRRPAWGRVELRGLWPAVRQPVRSRGRFRGELLITPAEAAHQTAYVVAMIAYAEGPLDQFGDRGGRPHRAGVSMSRWPLLQQIDELPSLGSRKLTGPAGRGPGSQGFLSLPLPALTPTQHRAGGAGNQPRHLLKRAPFAQQCERTPSTLFQPLRRSAGSHRGPPDSGLSMPSFSIALFMQKTLNCGCHAVLVLRAQAAPTPARSGGRAPARGGRPAPSSIRLEPDVTGLLPTGPSSAQEPRP
jgi:hypothetical protein